ncbi:hypothetical protein [Amycolatopsis albispora]|uniref:Uncharacterized protein n=1 Tax=Amycolatopsis albispora TaxID=1804986 RepID=A0A344LG16_9PSEU|nr:hypothetical protein [Amycolatopsis albispora]AXB46990.1 hypothetical protein A4R43_34850 [Amycolatopsis albispora]
MPDDFPTQRLKAAARRAEEEIEAFARRPVEEPSRGPSEVYSVRLPVERIEELRALADRRGVAPTALIRNWVLAQLDAAYAGSARTRQWERELRETTDKLRELLDERPWVPVRE